uniref:Uncharacterized protein n=1 Tax=Rhizophora mucronata TaxID=61149 RepID=A0A2P2Q521_RHIMU
MFHWSWRVRNKVVFIHLLTHKYNFRSILIKHMTFANIVCFTASIWIHNIFVL